MNNQSIGPLSGASAPEVVTLWPGASPCDVPARPERAEPLKLFRRTGLLIATLCRPVVAATFPAFGQGVSNLSAGSTRTHSSRGPGLTNAARANWLFTNQGLAALFRLGPAWPPRRPWEARAGPTASSKTRETMLWPISLFTSAPALSNSLPP